MTSTADGRRVRGDLTRARVLDEAIQRASVDGLDGLSIGTLSSVLGMSKSGLVGLFGSKEGLQLAALERAREVFVGAVVVHGERDMTAITRLALTLDRWIDHSRDRVFAGGCFFRAVSVEFDARPGILRDRIRANIRDWNDYLERLARRAVDEGDLEPDCDVEQLLFEVEAFYALANDTSVLNDDDAIYERARTAIHGVLIAAGADAELLPGNSSG